MTASFNSSCPQQGGTNPTFVCKRALKNLPTPRAAGLRSHFKARFWRCLFTTRRDRGRRGHNAGPAAGPRGTAGCRGSIAGRQHPRAGRPPPPRAGRCRGSGTASAVTAENGAARGRAERRAGQAGGPGALRPPLPPSRPAPRPPRGHRAPRPPPLSRRVGAGARPAPIPLPSAQRPRGRIPRPRPGIGKVRGPIPGGFGAGERRRRSPLQSRGGRRSRPDPSAGAERMGGGGGAWAARGGVGGGLGGGREASAAEGRPPMPRLFSARAGLPAGDHARQRPPPAPRPPPGGGGAPLPAGAGSPSPAAPSADASRSSPPILGGEGPFATPHSGPRAPLPAPSPRSRPGGSRAGWALSPGRPSQCP